MERRDFLLLRVGATRRSRELSCERLYMRYVDARGDGTIADLFAHLERELHDVDQITLTEVGWLARDDVRAPLDGLLDRLRTRGVRIEGRPGSAAVQTR